MSGIPEAQMSGVAQNVSHSIGTVPKRYESREHTRAIARAAMKRYRAKHAEKIKERKALYKIRNPEKRYARRVIDYHTNEKKDMPRVNVCSQCASIGKMQAHHDDYSKPLEVRWLCSPCHGAYHCWRKQIVA